jgi:hypothetical protein
VAVRFPAHPAARALIDEAGVPIAAPSANRSGRPSPTTARHVLEDMDGRIPLILDGGACQVGLESTVIDMTGEVPRVLRPGGITPKRIAEICGGVAVDEAVMRPLKEGEIARSPGMKYRHYAPAGELTIVKGGERAVIRRIAALYDHAAANGQRPLILALEGHIDAYGERHALSLGPDAAGMAHALFNALRDADREGRTGVGFGEAGDPANTVTQGAVPAVAFAQNQRNEVRQMDVVGALAAEPGMKQTAYIAQGGGMDEPQYVVRRITPVEAERLQGFPDGWTDIEYNGRPAPDTLRYKALGNSMTCTVMRWLAERILEADKDGN